MRISCSGRSRFPHWIANWASGRDNSNLLCVNLRELPLTVLCVPAGQISSWSPGNPGRVKITANDRTVLCIPVTSQNAALIDAIATFITKGGVQVTIKGAATVDAVLFCWSVLSGKTLPVTMEQVSGSRVEKKSE